MQKHNNRYEFSTEFHILYTWGVYKFEETSISFELLWILFGKFQHVENLSDLFFLFIFFN